MSRAQRSLEMVLTDLKAIIEHTHAHHGEKGSCAAISAAVSALLTQDDLPLNTAPIDEYITAHKAPSNPSGTEFSMDDDCFITGTHEGEPTCELTEKGRLSADQVIDHMSTQEPGSILSCWTEDHCYLIYVHDADHVFLVDSDQNLLFNVKEDREQWYALAATGYFADDEANEVTVANMGHCRLVETPLVTDKVYADAHGRGSVDSERSPTDRFREAVRTSSTSGTATPDHDTSDDASNAPRK